MKKFTFLFELFDKKGKYVCYAIDRQAADKEFQTMLKRRTRMDSVVEEKDDRQPKKPFDFMGEKDIFSEFADIFGKGWLNFGK